MKTAYLVYCANNQALPHFPESSLALAAELKKINIPVKIIDLRLVNQRKIKIEDPLFFGFTIYSNESIKYALDFAKAMRREFPRTPLVWGGPHVHMMPEQTAEHALVDLACYGEGETTISELGRILATGSNDFSKIPQVVYKQNGLIQKTPQQPLQKLDDIEFYPYELLDLPLYEKAAKTHFYYQTSRGCVHHCRFCNYNYQYTWRGKSGAKVTAEIQEIVERFHPYELYFSDANFFADKNRVQDILLRVKAANFPDFRWMAFCRFDDLSAFSDELMALMKDTGCLRLNLGGESGSDRILSYLNKGVTIKQIQEGLKRCVEYGIVADVSFIAGVPGETDDDLCETLTVISDIYKKYPGHMVNGLFYYQPYPNTPLMEEIAGRYALPIPHDLSGWGHRPVTSPRREYFPWLSDKAYSKIFSLTQIVNFLYLKQRLEDYLKNGVMNKKYVFLLKLCGILTPFVKLRLKKKNFDFPWEWKLYYFLKKRFVGMDL